jgi:hypothetical protein
MRDTQQKRILNLLRNYAPNWVPLPEILALGIGQYNARLLELRRSGYQIENKVEVHGEVRHSFYRLVTGSQRELPL